jgi:hypothetical protein
MHLLNYNSQIISSKTRNKLGTMGAIKELLLHLYSGCHQY